MGRPNFQPAVWLIIRVCAHQLVRSSGPSTDRMKSLMALTWSSQLIGGMNSDAPCAAVLNDSVMSGLACCPARDVSRPSRIANQRPVSSSRALIWATRLRSLSRSRKAGCRRAASLSACARPHRMTENFTVAMVMGFLTVFFSPPKPDGAFSWLLREHDLVRKPVPTFRDHALSCDLHARRARLARRGLVIHGALDLARAGAGQRGEPPDQDVIGARGRQHEAQAAEHRAV